LRDDLRKERERNSGEKKEKGKNLLGGRKTAGTDKVHEESQENKSKILFLRAATKLRGPATANTARERRKGDGELGGKEGDSSGIFC